MKSPRAGMVTNHRAAGPVYGERGRWASSCKLTPGAPPPPPAREAASTIWLYAHRGRTNLCGNNDSDEDLKLFHCSELDVGNFSGNFPHLKNFLRKSRSSGVQPESLRGGVGGAHLTEQKPLATPCYWAFYPTGRLETGNADTPASVRWGRVWLTRASHRQYSADSVEIIRS